MNQPMNEMSQQSESHSTEPPQPPSYQQPSPQAPQARPVAYNDSRRKSPLLAAVLSFILPGVGQVYIGYYQRGFIHAIVFALAITLLTTDMGPATPLGAIFVAFFFLYNVVDAWRRASLYNYALDGGSEIQLPDDFQMPGFRGSVIGGASLVVVGAILLANTRFGMSLDWIEDWWPAAIIIFGGYLVFKAVQEKAAAE